MKSAQTQEIIKSLTALLEEEREDEARQALGELHPADIADVAERMPEEERDALFKLLIPELAGEVLLKADEATRSQILAEAENSNLAKILVTMPPDEAADVVGDLPEGRSEEILQELPKSASDAIKNILEYPEDSAGGIMTPVLVRAQDEMTVAQAIGHVREARLEEEGAFYLYAVDGQGRLAGVVTMRALVVFAPDTRLSTILTKQVATVPAEADQEDIAEMFRRYDYLAMPVVDRDGRLIGQITADDVVDVLSEEATEDAYLMAGTDDAELATHSVFQIARIRIVWLFVCLGGTMFAGVIIRFFEVTLAEKLGLMAFVPAIMAMGGNSGVQTSTVMVRSLATGAVGSGHILRALFRELRVGLTMGIVCGLAATLVAHLWLGELKLGVVVGVSMFLGIAIAANVGAVLPVAIRRFGGDPAVACGPLITTVNDIAGLFIYLGIAKAVFGAS